MKFNLTAICLPFLLGVTEPCFPQQADKPATIITSSVKERISQTLKSFVDSGKIKGVSALVFERGKEVYFDAFGYANSEAGKTFDRNTLVRIYSMTKPITGVALMTLFEKGLFKLDDPISKYLPEFSNMQVYKGLDANGKMLLEPAKRPITIRDITRHTSGLASTTSLPGYNELYNSADPMNPANTLSQMAKKLASLPLLFQPGEQWSYGPSVDVQALLVERISGKPFAQYLQENIFNPLGMTHTGYMVPAASQPYLATTYRRSATGELAPVAETEKSFNLYPWALTPGGFGLTSSIDDYMKFAQMLLNKGRLGKAIILKPQTVNLMATNQLSDTISQRMWLPSKGQVGFGIDFAVRTKPPANAAENNGMVGEFFWDGAASTLFWVDPVNQLTAVLFVQVMPFYGDLHKRFRDAVYGNYQPK